MDLCARFARMSYTNPQVANSANNFTATLAFINGLVHQKARSVQIAGSFIDTKQ